MPIESSPPKTNIGDAAKHKSLVGRVKRGLNLADGTVESNKAFRNIRQTAKLIAAEYFDFKKPWKSKDERTITTTGGRVVRTTVISIWSRGSTPRVADGTYYRC